MLLLLQGLRVDIVTDWTQLGLKMLPRDLFFLEGRHLLKVDWYWFLWVSEMWLWGLMLIRVQLSLVVFLWFIKPRDLLRITFHGLILTGFISWLLNLCLWAHIVFTFLLLNVDKLIPDIGLVQAWLAKLIPWVFWFI